VTRLQLRDLPDPGSLSRVPYDHARWPEHVARVAHTAAILAAMVPASVADLSCGDGAVVTAAGLAASAILGDVAAGWPWCGLIEDTVTRIPAVDVFVCSETLEHVADPDWLLAAIRGKAARLLLSTPAGEGYRGNPEHVWSWDVADLEAMLTAAGWEQREVELYTPPPASGSAAYYTYQIWVCS
jgi:hypothetical protein